MPLLRTERLPAGAAPVQRPPQAHPRYFAKDAHQHLETLETDGYINRKVSAEVPPRVEYSLTSRAESLIPVMNDLIGWASDNMAAILKARTKAV